MKYLKYFFITFLTTLASFTIFGLVTAVITNPFFTRMTSVSYFDLTYLILSSLFLGIYVGLHFYEKDYEKNNKGKNIKVCSVRSNYGATGGTIISFLAFSCPICNSILIYLFGATALLTYYQPIQPILGFFGIGILILAVYFKIKNIRR